MKNTPPKELLKFPLLVVQLVWQLVYYTFTEAETFLLAVVAALFGYHYGLLWGLTVYFSIYLVMRMVGGYVGMIANKLDFIARTRGRG
jgi:hypothetical protein